MFPKKLERLSKLISNDDQKYMMLVNMADLAYRNGDPHDDEVNHIKSFAGDINFDLKKLDEILELFRVKNDASILQDY